MVFHTNWSALLLFPVFHASFKYQAVSQMSWFPRHKNVTYMYLLKVTKVIFNDYC